MIDLVESTEAITKQTPEAFHPKEVAAREILTRRLEAPPTLDALARRTGMNHVKLNRGFKELYGTTVFGLLRELRLDKAKELLLSGEMNVTETSYSVGYSSLSYFSRIFKDHHGLSPGDCVKRYSKV
ncbi:MAG: AraC family transcriptional regulator [Desulfobacterales bacterium]|nr:AraC family transcriptional regulator [Desulfobacterales bacterium]